MVTCATCVEDFQQCRKRENRNGAVVQNFYSSLYKNPRFFPDDTQNVHTKMIIQESLISLQENVEIVSDSLYLELLLPVRSRVLRIVDVLGEKYNDECCKVEGGGFPPYFDMNHFQKNNFIENPDDGSVGIIIFPRNDNFLMIFPSDIPNEAIVEFSKEETKNIATGMINGRAGAAGGVVNSDTNSHSMSACTQKSTSLMVGRPNSVGMSVLYQNGHGKATEFKSIYNDLHMNRLTKQTKRENAYDSVSMRQVLLREMVTRIKTIVIVKSLGLLDDGEDNLKALSNILEDDTATVEQFKKLGHSLFESMLLAWSCTTGEMRNHEAIKAHKDGNKSHKIETLTLFGRVWPGEIDSVHNTVKQMKGGALIFPLDGVGVNYRSGRDIIHCNLKNTIHLPDDSRNLFNWSKVHGPA